MSAILQLAKLFGVKPDAVDDAIRSERGYRAALSRRSLFAVAGALAVGSVMRGGPIPLYVFTDDSEWYIAANLDEAYGAREDHIGCEMDREDYSLEQLPGHFKMGILSFADGNIASHDDDYDFIATRTMDEWIRRVGAGFLCTVEH